MKLKVPNIPEKSVKTIIIDGRVPASIIRSLEKEGIAVVPTAPHPDVYAAIAYHPDIMLHHIGGSKIVYAPNTSQHLLDTLRDMGFDLVTGQVRLTEKYPGTIAYNIARVGKFAIHNTKFTDPVTKALLISEGVEFIHTNQGYTKCLTCIVDSNSIITSDTDIHKTASEAGLDSLLIEPDEAIRLEPFSMGFIGGATGLIGKYKLAVAGNLGFHKNYEKILSFLSLKHVDVVMLNDEKPIDIGTLIPIEQH